jgi:glycosyltransferase involved in cell wall biosynthesis
VTGFRFFGRGPVPLPIHFIPVRAAVLKLLFTNFHDGDGGGHATYVLALAGALAARHRVHVAAPPGSRLHREASLLPGVHALAQPFPNGLNRLRARRHARRQLSARLREHDFDLVHVNGSADHRLVMAAMRALPRRPRIVLTKHNSKPMTGIGHWWRARRGTDLVIAVCDYTHRALATSPYRRCRLATVHNGVDIAHFAPWPAAQAQAQRQRWVADPHALLLGSNAGTADYKGWMDLVEALALLPPAPRRRVHLLIAGRPPEMRRLQRIAELGLADQVHLPGLLADVRPAMAAIDAGFVLSWDVETISFACREMMAMGKPVLVSDYAGLPENIRPQVDGWCVPPRDPAAMARLLQQLLQQRDALPAMGAAARRHAEEAFGLSRFVDSTEAAYAALLAAR